MDSDDPRFTAYALGEPLPAAERAEVETAVAQRPELRAELEAIQAFAGDLRSASRGVELPRVAAAPAPSRIVPFRREAESAPWQRQLVRIAAVFLLSAGCIAGAGWWTAQREARAKLPPGELAGIEVELAPFEAGAPELPPARQAETMRGAVKLRWEQLAAALRAGRLPVAAEVPAAAEILSLLPFEQELSSDRISVTAAAKPGSASSAWLRVAVPAQWASKHGTVRVESNRRDEAEVREVASGLGPSGERLVLFEVKAAQVLPALRVVVPGKGATEVGADAFRGEFARSADGLRRAVVLARLGEALRSEGETAKDLFREVARLAEAAGESTRPWQALADDARALL